MKKLLLLFTSLAVSVTLFAQNPKITWGEEFKMGKGSTDLSVMFTDNTGVYLQEKHQVLKGYFVIATTTRESATLLKLDKSLAEIYRNDFNKELRGKEFEQFATIGDKIYILASNYSRRDKTLTLFAAPVDNSTGELAGEWAELASWTKDEKKDDINFKLTSNADNTSLILVSSIEGREKTNFQVQEFNKNLKSIGKPINISNEFEPATFQLEDVLYTSAKKIVMVARIYAYEEGKKKKARFLNFDHYNIRIYDNTGKQQTEINTNVNGKWLVSTKVLQEPDKDLVVAAFYSNEKRGKGIDGLLVQRIDPNTGSVITTSQEQINTSLITPLEDDNTPEDDTDDDSRKERKERERLNNIKDESEAFNRYMHFRNIFYTPDNGIVILAEKYYHYTYTTTSSYTPSIGGATTYTTHTYTVYETGDLMMCKVDVGGNINWLRVLPKQQREVVYGYGSGGGGFYIGTSYFYNYNLPFYSSFGALQNNNNISIMFNDNPKNENVLQLGQKVKRTTNFRRSTCYNLVLDATTGKYTRKEFFSNKEVPTAMPRLGSYIGNDMYMVGRDDRLFGRTKVAVAKVTMGK